MTCSARGGLGGDILNQDLENMLGLADTEQARSLSGLEAFTGVDMWVNSMGWEGRDRFWSWERGGSQ